MSMGEAGSAPVRRGSALKGVRASRAAGGGCVLVGAEPPQDSLSSGGGTASHCDTGIPAGPDAASTDPIPRKRYRDPIESNAVV